MTKHVRAAVLAGLAAACCGTGVLAQTGSTLSPADKKFLTKAHEGNEAEIKLAKLALEKSNSSDVKEFANKMIHDHGNLIDDLSPYTKQMSVPPPDAVNPADQALETKLSALSGDQFDKLYIQSMVKDHEKDLKEFKEEARKTHDKDLKHTVEQATTLIQGHLDMIQGISKKNNVSTS